MEETVTGVLTVENDVVFLKGLDGQNHLKSQHIWEGYVTLWKDLEVHAQQLPQKDYENGKYMYLEKNM